MLAISHLVYILFNLLGWPVFVDHTMIKRKCAISSHITVWFFTRKEATSSPLMEVLQLVNYKPDFNPKSSFCIAAHHASVIVFMISLYTSIRVTPYLMLTKKLNIYHCYTMIIAKISGRLQATDIRHLTTTELDICY